MFFLRPSCLNAQDITNLIGYWPANEGDGEVVANVVDSDSNGTLMNGAWSDDGGGHTGLAGDYAFEIMGESSSHVEVPTTDVEFNEITITAWIKGVPAGAWTGIVYSRSAQAIGLDFHNATGNLTYTWNNNSGDTWGFDSGLTVPEDEWTFVGMALRADSNTFFLGTTGPDGTFSMAVNELDHVPQTHDQAPFLFGVDLCCGNGRNFDGFMDDVAIWDVALTEEQMRLLWTGQATPLDVFDNSDPGLVVSGSVDFGRLPFVAGAQELSFPIRNSGASEVLTIEAALTTGGEHFTLTSFPQSLAPGAVENVGVGFDPKGGTGQFLGEIELKTNDPDEEDQVVTVSLAASLVDPSGPAAYFPLDDLTGTTAIIDTTGNGRSGMLENSAGTSNWEEAAVASTGLKIAGGAHVSVPSGLTGLESFTASLWINTAPSEISVLFANGSTVTPGVAVLLAGGDLRWFFDSEDIFGTPGAPILSGTNHHVVVLYDAAGPSVAFYVDGVEVANESVDAVDFSDPADILSFGGIGANPGLGMDAVLDDIQLYDRALSLEEVIRLRDNPGSTLVSTGAVDSDQDGLSDEDEATRGTDPLNPDSDDDGLTDGAEVNTHGTDPMRVDTDGDTLSDGREVGSGTDPLDPNDPAEITAIAYIVPTDTAGNQDFGGALGHDFIVESPIIVRELGVFDDGSDGLTSDLFAELWSRDDNGTPDNVDDDVPGEVLAELVFSSADEGVLVNGSRFKSLAAPLRLEPGAYTIIAHGYGAGESNGNQGSVNLNTSTDNGGAALRFIGGGRWGNEPGEWPTNIDGGPVDRYAAGTFTFTVIREGNPAADSDGDGSPDAEEALAGTDPNDPNDYFHITALSREGDTTTLSWPAKSGISYIIEFSETLNGDWTPVEGGAVAGTGNELSLDFPRSAEQGYYRIRTALNQ